MFQLKNVSVLPQHYWRHVSLLSPLPLSGVDKQADRVNWIWDKMLGMYASNVNKECFVRREGMGSAQGDLWDLEGEGGEGVFREGSEDAQNKGGGIQACWWQNDQTRCYQCMCSFKDSSMLCYAMQWIQKNLIISLLCIPGLAQVSLFYYSGVCVQDGWMPL